MMMKRQLPMVAATASAMRWPMVMRSSSTSFTFWLTEWRSRAEVRFSRWLSTVSTSMPACGCVIRNLKNSSRPSKSVVTSSVAFTVAARGSSLNMDSSPKKPPGPISSTSTSAPLASITSTCTWPDTST